MKKRITVLLILAITILLTTAFSMQNTISYAQAGYQVQNMNFADNKVVVIMTNEESLEFRQYTSKDFSLINAIEVQDLTAGTTALVQKQVAAEKSGAIVLSAFESEYAFEYFSESRLNNAIAMQSSNVAQNELKVQQYMQFRQLEHHIERNLLVDTYNFRRILKITLFKNCRLNVLRAIRILERETSIAAVHPVYYIEYEERRVSNLDGVNYSSMDAFSQGRCLRHYQYGLEKINAFQAQNISMTNREVVVGIIDSGVDSSHPSLKNRMHRGYPFHNYQTTWHRYFGVDGKMSVVYPVDRSDHGTMVTGIIMAESEYIDSVVGSNINVSWVSLKIGRAPLNEFSNAVMAIDHATSKGMDIINFSRGYSTSVAGLLQAISQFPGLFVAAAENRHHNIATPGINDFPIGYKRNHNLPRFIGVGSTNAMDNRAARTAFWYQEGTVDNFFIFAPGYDIVSTSSFGWLPEAHIIPGYIKDSGTSFATPKIVGTAALMMAVNPMLTPEEIRSIIINTADRISVQINLAVVEPPKYIDARRLNVYAAVRNSTFKISNLTNNAVHLNGFYYSPHASIYIPSTIGGRAITHIGSYAFAFNTRLRTINIPASVEHIGSRAFWHNSELRRVYLNRTHEQGITALGCNYVFFAASQLYWISVPIGSYYRYRLSASWAIHRDIISVFEPIRVDLIDGIGSNFWMTVNRRLGVGLNLANMIPPGRPGHTFAGWRATDGTRIYNNKIISRASHGRLICNNHPFPSKMTYRIVLEARWSAIKSFNTQTAEVIEPMAVYIGDRVGDLPAPARAGFAFGGWWTETGGQGAKITSTSIAHSNQTLFAHWFVPGQYRHMNTISFSGQGQIEVSGIFEGRAMYIRFETLQRTTFSAHIDEHGNFWAVALEHIPNLKIEIMGSVQDGVIRLNVAGGFGTRITARIYFV